MDLAPNRQKTSSIIQMNRKQNPGKLLQQLPTKWAVAVVVGLVAYALLQPVANQRMGWGLPSLAVLLGQQESPASVEEASQANSGTTEQVDSKSSSDGSNPENVGEKPQSQVAEAEEGSSVNPEEADRSSTPEKQVAQPRGPPASSVEGLRYGLLTEIGKDDYLSPGGLRYTSGSDEGHRLKHLERHLKDQPDRPSSHGVFYGDMPQVLRWLDEVYDRAQAGQRGTRKEVQGPRTVFEASFEKPVGYVGGRNGARKGNPDTRRIKLVVDGNRVITAYPF